MLKFTVLSIALFGSAIFAIAQTPAQDPKPEVKVLIDQGLDQNKARKFQDAIKIFTEAIKVAQSLGDTFGEAEAHRNTGKSYQLIGDFAKARESFVRAKDLYHISGPESLEMMTQGAIAQTDYQLGRPKEALPVLLELISYFESKGDKKGKVFALASVCFVEGALRMFDDQLKHAKEAKADYIALGDLEGQGKAMIQIAFALKNLKRRDESIKAYEDVALFARTNNLKSTEATAVANLGQFFSGEGDFQKAIDYYRQAQELYKAANSTGLAAEMGISLGIAYFQVGQPKLSIATFRESADTFRMFGNKPKLATTLVNLGVVLEQLRDDKPAEEALKEALGLYVEMGQDDGADACYVTLGSIYVRQERFAEAAEVVKKGLAIAEKLGDKQDIATTYETLGNIALGQGQLEEALKCFSKSVGVYRELNNRPFLADTLSNVAKTLRRLGRLAESQTTYEESIGLLEEVRAQSGSSSEGRAGLMAQALLKYHDYIALLVQMGNVTEAFDLTQKTKARSLLDLMELGEVSVQRDMTPAEKSKEAELRKVADDINVQMVQLGAQNEVGSKQRYAALKVELERAETALAEFKTQLFAKYPGLEDRRSAKTATLQEVAALLPKGTALLEYVYAEELLVFVVRFEDGKPIVTCKQLKVKPKDLLKDIEDFRVVMSDPSLSYQPLSTKLYQSLVEPVANHLKLAKSLIICPDGPFWDVPFAALTDGKFLAEKFEVSYGNSATAVEAALRSPIDRTKEKSLLILANPDFGGVARFGDNPLIPGQRPIEPPSRPIEPPSRPIEPPSRPIEPPSRPIDQPSRDLGSAMRDGIVDLPGTQKEAEAIAKMYPQAVLLTREKAQESAFKKDAGRFQFLHIASHAFFNDASPMLSSIVLAKPSDSTTDGYLTARELFDMKLSADLIVLSACNTARGEEQSGEGIVGLSWALFAAGVPAQVVSQWSVDDQAAAALMTGFYRNLKSGDSKSKALKRASTSLMGQKKWRHPYYWAPFILIGDNR